MVLELDDEELTDVREALRVQLMGMMKALGTSRRADVRYMRARLERVEELYRRLERAPVTGAIAATH